MATIKNFYGDTFFLEMNLVKNNSFLYDKEKKDYENWIPVEIRLIIEGVDFVGYYPNYYPTLSLEGIKNFLTIKNKLIEEKQRLKIRLNDGNNKTYSSFSYMSTDGDFEIIFKNLYDDEREVSVVEITLWCQLGGYSQGWQFITTMYECLNFFDNIKKQLQTLIKYPTTNG